MHNVVDLVLRPKLALRRWKNHLAVKRSALQSPCRVVVGTSGLTQSGWISTDIDALDLLKPDTWERYFSDASLDAILAEHVWEHLTPEQGQRAAETCFRFLKPAGYLRVAVPDGFHPDQDYQQWVRPGGSGPGALDHQVLYTFESLSRSMAAAGFSVELLEYFDSSGQFHFRPWSVDDGMIHRSKDFDARNRDGRLGYTSVILDAVKPTAPRKSSPRILHPPLPSPPSFVAAASHPQT